MIIKSSQRAGHAELAAHLVKKKDIDGTPQKVTVSGNRDLASNDNVHDALQDMAILSQASQRCQKDLYHISMNPSQEMTEADWNAAWEAYEKEFGLSHLPYIEVTHDKGEHRQPHKHRVYERVDVETGKAVHLNHTRIRNEKVARVVEFTLGHPLTVGKHNRTVMKQLEQDGQSDIIAWMREGHAHDCERPAANQNHADVQQEKRTDLPTEQVKAELQACYKAAVDGRSFQVLIAEKGYALAKGDKRDFVIVDATGSLHSPRRRLGVRAKELRDRWADLQREQLEAVEAVVARLKGQWEAETAASAAASESDNTTAASNDNQASAGQGRGGNSRKPLSDLQAERASLDQAIDALEAQLEQQNAEALNQWQRHTVEPEPESPKPRPGAKDAHRSGRGGNVPLRKPLNERQIASLREEAAIAERQRRLLALRKLNKPINGKAPQGRRLAADEHDKGLDEYRRIWQERFGAASQGNPSRVQSQMADRWILERLAKKGYSRQQSRRILMQASPEVMNQRPGDRLLYVRRMVEKVYGSHEQRQTQLKKAEKPKTDRDKVPGKSGRQQHLVAERGRGDAALPSKLPAKHQDKEHDREPDREL